MERFKVVGMGPGGKDYILPAAIEAIRKAQILVGAPRQIEAASEWCEYNENEEKPTFVYRSNLEELTTFIRNNRSKRIVLLVSGDPGFHSLLRHVSQNFQPEDYEVIPGVSSFQTAMARLGLPWQEDTCISCHGKDLEADRQSILETLESDHRLILLTDAKRTPSVIAAELLVLGIGNRHVRLGMNLTLPEEELLETSLQALAAHQEPDRSPSLCVMIIL